MTKSFKEWKKSQTSEESNKKWKRNNKKWQTSKKTVTKSDKNTTWNMRPRFYRNSHWKKGPNALNLTNTQILWTLWLTDICMFRFIYWINSYNVQERLVSHNRTWRAYNVMMFSFVEINQKHGLNLKEFFEPSTVVSWSCSEV